MRLAKPRFNDCFNDNVTGQRVFRGNEVPRSILTKVVRIKNLQETRGNFLGPLFLKELKFVLDEEDVSSCETVTFLRNWVSLERNRNHASRLGLKFLMIIT